MKISGRSNENSARKLISRRSRRSGAPSCQRERAAPGARSAGRARAPRSRPRRTAPPSASAAAISAHAGDSPRRHPGSRSTPQVGASTHEIGSHPGRQHRDRDEEAADRARPGTRGGCRPPRRCGSGRTRRRAGSRACRSTRTVATSATARNDRLLEWQRRRRTANRLTEERRHHAVEPDRRHRDRDRQRARRRSGSASAHEQLERPVPALAAASPSRPTCSSHDQMPITAAPKAA